jgi:hypothetical protein
LIAPITGVGKVRIPTMALKMYWKAAQKEWEIAKIESIWDMIMGLSWWAFSKQKGINNRRLIQKVCWEAQNRAFFYA